MDGENPYPHFISTAPQLTSTCLHGAGKLA